ncbi:MAG: hypothetical protein IJB96_09980 [Lachnospira sp.]|nr:hypothetical protein [Lachnospira sp.]
MTEKLTDLNEALPGVLLIDLAYLVLGEIIIFLFIPNPVFYAIGFLVGVLYAVICVFHMSFQIRKAVYGGASKAMVIGSVTRMAIMFAVFVALYYSNIGDIFAAFIGMLSMKVSAYAEPSVRGLTSRILKKGG